MKKTISIKLLSSIVAGTFLLSSIMPPRFAIAQNAGALLTLPTPGVMVTISPGHTPALIRGVMPDPTHPLSFNFFVDTGDEEFADEELRVASSKLIKYFLAALTVPEDELWVNLSPYEKDRVVPDGLGATEMGRDLLAQDYILKQLAASLMYPENELGQKFWERIRQRVYELHGTTEIPTETFNKVWVMPQRAVVLEHQGGAFIVEAHLKVMLEEDYVALQHVSKEERRRTTDALSLAHHSSSIGTEPVISDIIREIIIPEIEREVNEGSTFANLRQIYHSMILASWYKKRLRQGILGATYIDQNKVKGIDLQERSAKEKIYEQYLEAFKRGVYAYIREDYDPASKEFVPRKYFSGGIVAAKNVETIDLGMLTQQQRTSLQPKGDVHQVKVALYGAQEALDERVQFAPYVSAESADSAMLAKLKQRVGDMVTFNYRTPDGLASFRGTIDRLPSDTNASYRFVDDNGSALELTIDQIEEYSSGERLDPAKAPAYKSQLPQNSGTIYAQYAAESRWNTTSIRHSMDYVDFDKLDENSVVMAVSSGSGIAERIFLEELKAKRPGLKIKRLIVIDIDTAWARQLMEYNMVDLREFEGEVVGSIEYYIMKDKGNGHYASPVELGIVKAGEVQLMTNFHAIHLFQPQQIAALAQDAAHALSEEGQLIIGSGGIHDQRPSGQIGIDTLFERIRRQGLSDLLSQLKILDAIGYPADAIIKEVERSVSGVPSGWVSKILSQTFPQPALIAQISDLQRSQGINSVHSFHSHPLEREDFRYFVTKIEALVNGGIFPELMLFKLELASMLLKNGKNLSSPEIIKLGDEIKAILAGLDQESLGQHLDDLIERLKVIRDNVVRATYDQLWDESGEFTQSWSNFIGKKTAIEKQQPEPAQKILIVEDYEDIRTLFEMMLLIEGYEVVSVADINAAKKVLEGQDISFVLSDIRDPFGAETGFILAEHIVKEYPHIKVKLMSGYYDGQISQALAASPQFLGILPKPIPDITEEVKKIIGPPSKRLSDKAQLANEDLAMATRQQVERVMIDGLEVGQESVIDLSRHATYGIRVQTGSDPQEDIMFSIDLSQKRNGYIIVHDVSAHPLDSIYISELTEGDNQNVEEGWFNGEVIFGNDMGEMSLQAVAGDFEPDDFEPLISISYQDNQVILRNRGVIFPLQVNFIGHEMPSSIPGRQIMSNMPLWEMAMAADPLNAQLVREMLENALQEQREKLQRAREERNQADISIFEENIAHLQRNIQSLVPPDSDKATTAPGGIDLNPALLDLQIILDPNGLALPENQQPIMNMVIEGFIPVIINITPVYALPPMLGHQSPKTREFLGSKV